MTGPLLRLALVLSWKSRGRDLLSSLMLTLIAACLAFVMAGSISLFQSSQQAESRLEARAVHSIGSVRDGQFDAFRSAAASDANDQDYDMTFDTWIWSSPDGRSLRIVVLKTTNGPATFAGIDLAKPGWYVSEGFRTGVTAHPGYAHVLADATLLGRDVLHSPTELLAVQVLSDDASFTHGIVGVIDPAGATKLGSDDPLDLTIETLAILVVLALCTVLLWSALNLGMNTQRARERVLSDLGADQFQIKLLRVATACAITLPGLVLGVVLWQVIADDLTVRPVDSLSVFPGDLSLSWPALLVAAALMFTVVAAASLARSHAGSNDSEHRGGGAPRAAGLYWFAPFVIATLLAIRLDAGSQQDVLLGVGLLAFIAALWANVPLLLSLLGKSLANLGRERVAWLLAGRRLQNDARSTGRALGFIVVLALLTPLVGVFFDANTPDQTSDESALSAYDFGPVGLPGDYERFAAAADLSTVPLPVIFSPQAQRNSDGSVAQPLMLAPGICDEWADPSRDTRCENGTLVGATPMPITFVGDDLSLADAGAAATNYLVRYDRPEQRVLVHQQATLLNVARVSQRGFGEIDNDALYPPSFAVVNRYRDPVYERNVDWIVTLTGAVLLTAGIVSLLFVALRSRRTGSDRSRLGAIGATRQRIRLVAFIETSAAMLTVSLVGLVAAAIVFFCLRIADPTIALPRTEILIWEAAALLAISLSAAASAAAAVGDPARLWNDQNSSMQ